MRYESVIGVNFSFRLCFPTILLSRHSQWSDIAKNGLGSSFFVRKFSFSHILTYLISETNSHYYHNLLPESGTVSLIASHIFESVDKDKEEMINWVRMRWVLSEKETRNKTACTITHLHIIRTIQWISFLQLVVAIRIFVIVWKSPFLAVGFETKNLIRKFELQQSARRILNLNSRRK